MKITGKQLKTTFCFLSFRNTKKYDDLQNVAIHRGELQKILANEIGYENINFIKTTYKN